MENFKTVDPKELEHKTEPFSLSVGLSPTALTGGPRPDLNGRRIRDPGQHPIYGTGAIYFVDQGRLRYIPSPETYNNLFRDWAGIIEDPHALDIYESGPIMKETILASPTGYGTVWLIDWFQRRQIGSPEVMDRYHFAWERIYRVPPLLVFSIPQGPDVV